MPEAMHRGRPLSALLVSLCTLCLLATGPRALPAESNRVTTRQVEATLVSDAAAISANSSFWVGLRLRIKPGWHTYWQNPGDSGLATSIEWQLPEGMVAGTIRWPAPDRFATGHLMNYGYADEVVLLTRMSAWSPIGTGGDVVLAADARWLVCDDVCIMEEGRFELGLPVAAATTEDAEGKSLIAKYAALLPAASSGESRFTASADTIRLRAALPMHGFEAADDVWFYPERFGVIDHAAPQQLRTEGSIIELTLTRGELKHEQLEQLRGVLVFRSEGKRPRGISVDARPG